MILTAWEHIDPQSLLEKYKFYTFAADVASLLSLLNCVIRLPTYLACDRRFRDETGRFFRWMCTRGRIGRRPTVERQRNPHHSRDFIDFQQVTAAVKLKKQYDEFLPLSERGDLCSGVDFGDEFSIQPCYIDGGEFNAIVEARV